MSAIRPRPLRLRPPTATPMAIATAALLLAGCASTRVDINGEVPETALCQPAGQHPPTLILWQTDWRSDQKDLAERDAAAGTVMADYFAGSPCFAASKLHRLPGGQPTDQDLQGFGRNAKPAVARVLWIRLRELGPLIRLFASPALIDGGTEVVFELRAVDATSGKRLANLKTHWQHGGPGVIKGTATLPADLAAALDATLNFPETLR